MKKENEKGKTKLLWHAKDVKFALKNTNSTENGLSQEKVKEHLEKYGENSLPQKKTTSIFLLMLKEFLNPIVLILLIAMTFSFIVQEILDGFVIMGIILIDAILGAIQEKKAERIASSLSNMIKVNTKVLRDGEKTIVESSKLVVGDIVFLESGDKISADMRIIECDNFTVDESLITGESINVEKQINCVDAKATLGDRTCMVFSGSTVITGRAKCVVVETGLNTEIGNIADKLSTLKDEKSPLTIRINKFSKQISVLIVGVAVFIFLVMLIQQNPVKDIFLAVIALAVSAMPEGLPLAVTMALTISSNRMGKNNVVVKHLNAVESLGSCTVIATDKTGTLTLNEQTAKIISLPNGEEYTISGSGYNDRGSLEGDYKKSQENINQIAILGELNNESIFSKKQGKFEYFGDSIDIAFKVMAKKLKVKTKEYKIVKSIPYESENKYSAVFFEYQGETYCTVKGSPEKVSEFCSKMKIQDKSVEIDINLLTNQNQGLAKRGYRVIALAVGKVSQKTAQNGEIKNLTFIGQVGFIDPVRPESKNAIADCHTAGIKVIMITGDHPLTAYSIAEDINIASSFNQVATGKDVEKAFLLGEEEFDKFVKTKTVFSRVTPNDKLNIVESLKRQGEFVAVTGDGVNDSPAIKSAHIGIAMGSGTDVSKETADMIILDNNFNSIVDGVKEGRTAYSNIRKIIYFLISCSLGEVLFFVLAMIFGAGSPLLPIQLLWLNLVTDGFQDLSLSLEKSEPNIMQEKPRPTSESLFTKSMVKQCSIMGGVIGIVVFVVWILLGKVNNVDIVVARTLVMALMVFLQNAHALNARSETRSIFKISFLQNWFFIIAVFGSIGLQILFMEIPALSMLLDLTTVSYLTLVLLLLISLSIIVVSEIYKLINRKKRKKSENSN